MKNIGVFAVNLLSVIIFVLVSCSWNPSLENKTWVLESYGEPGNLKSVVKGKEITATFNSSGKKISGSDGCNAYAGKYKLKGKKLFFPEPFVVTHRACSDQLSREFRNILGTNKSYKIKDNKLTISSDSRVLIFRLR